MKGRLFDIYHIEEKIFLWVMDSEGKMHVFQDCHYPVIYLSGRQDIMDRIVARLRDLNALSEEPSWEIRKHFYSNQECRVLRLSVSKPSILKKMHKKLYVFYGIFDIYHSDIDLLSHYMHFRNIFPLALLEIESEGDRIIQIKSLEDIHSLEYEIPRMKIMEMKLSQSHRLPISSENHIVFKSGYNIYKIYNNDPKKMISEINAVMEIEDPDVILSSFGDQKILPVLFSISQDLKIPLLLDRDTKMKTVRTILTKGTSYNTYGQWIYRAASYPLFGRWHIDSQNSFVYKETELHGIIELARISRIPVQKLARSSTGTALTNIETFTAIECGYLVPWQKSSLENPKTAYELLQIDKGGLVFQPSVEETRVYENVVQLDFSQMYPSIMVNHNLSPETVNCICCNPETSPRVPDTPYHICTKRRGVVSLSLERILERRKHCKDRMKETFGRERELYNARQESLKWMLVTSFGYLGYRNAKFGKLESHESVTAFGRNKLLSAKEISEDFGYEFLHGITDCIFLRRRDGAEFSRNELNAVCSHITKETGINMRVEANFSWLVFPPSKSDQQLPVMNRYFGKKSEGSVKFRGLAARRRDMPVFVRSAQIELLSVMENAFSINELKELHSKVDLLYEKFASELKLGNIEWQDLLIRKTAGKSLEEYEMDTGTSLSMQELQEYGIEIQAGEKVKYVVVSQKNKNKSLRYLSEEKALAEQNKNAVFDLKHYEKLLMNAFEEVWQYFSYPEYFQEVRERQKFILFA